MQFHGCCRNKVLSLDGALRNELEKNASSLIPVEIVTEFVFAAASTITVPVAHQLALDALIEPADHLQSITVGYALCRSIDGKERLKVQRAAPKQQYQPCPLIYTHVI